jgi:hypothetical protein
MNIKHTFILVAGLILTLFATIAPRVSASPTAPWIVVNAAHSRAATNRYVSPTGTDNNVCSRQQPCRSIRRAIRVATSGDTIQIAAGTYSENLTINKNLIIKGAGVGGTTLDGRGTDSVVRVLGANVKILNLTVKNGNANILSGGGIFNTGRLRIKKANITSNIADEGGGIYNAGTLRLQKVNLISNNAMDFGGGLSNHGTATLKQVTIASNTAGYSAGIENRGDLRIEQSTIRNNSAYSGAAGGISNFAALVMGNVTISGNQTAVYGGGLYNESGTATLVHVTITENTGGSGGGGLVNVGTMTLYNTIVAFNTHGNCFGTVSDGGGNLQYSPADCGLTFTEDNPQLAPLANNGGFTETHALLPSSGAIDVGSSIGCIEQDQRGVARPLDGNRDGNARCDIGAYERQP